MCVLCAVLSVVLFLFQRRQCVTVPGIGLGGQDQLCLGFYDAFFSALVPRVWEKSHPISPLGGSAILVNGSHLNVTFRVGSIQSFEVKINGPWGVCVFVIKKGQTNAFLSTSSHQ